MVKKKRKKQQKPWQFQFTMGLTLLMLLLVGGYFFQSFLEIRKVQPVHVAFEQLGESQEAESVFTGGATLTKDSKKGEK